MLHKVAIADPSLYKFVTVLICIILICGCIGGLIIFFYWVDYDLGVAAGYFFAVFLGSLSVVASIIFELYLAGHFYFLGVDKGYPDVVYLRLCFFWTFIGYLMVVAMPDSTVKYANNQTLANDDLPDL